MKQLSMNENIIALLNKLSEEINNFYGYVTLEGDNFGEPAINSGPCGPFAHTFYSIWNQKFSVKVSIAFIMVKNSDECWHVLIRLPNGLLFDGGFGVHDEDKWDKSTFEIEDMKEYDLNLLEKHSGGLNRTYSRYCPNFSVDAITQLINKYLNLMN
ncbi:MAG TPA: hypothetical protein PK657_09865 [Legionella sp.]|nr:hypothetical protein [Legionella sp.]